jgi:hypothetical protein
VLPANGVLVVNRCGAQCKRAWCKQWSSAAQYEGHIREPRAFGQACAPAASRPSFFRIQPLGAPTAPVVLAALTVTR